MKKKEPGESLPAYSVPRYQQVKLQMEQQNYMMMHTVEITLKPLKSRAEKLHIARNSLAPFFPWHPYINYRMPEMLS